MAIKTFAEITPAQIKEWKSQNPKGLTQIDIALEEDTIGDHTPMARFIAKSPDRNILDAMAKYGQEGNITKANNVMLNSCILGGDMDYMEDKTETGIFLAVLEELGKLVEKKKSTVKKL